MIDIIRILYCILDWGASMVYTSETTIHILNGRIFHHFLNLWLAFWGVDLTFTSKRRPSKRDNLF